MAENPFGVRWAFQPRLTFGTKDLFSEVETVFFFGKRNEIEQSMAYNRLGHVTKELFFSLKFAYRRVFHNALIEGHLLGDTSTVLRQIEPSLFRLGIDLNHRFNSNDYTIGIRYSTKESASATSHFYAQISYALSF